MSLNLLLSALIKVSEKAASIARLCRSDQQLFALLVEEKKVDEANKRFLNDFKTLSDVLIQETIKHDIGKLFPELKESIYGEESNKFTNTLGESIVLEITDDFENTSAILEKVLDGNRSAAHLLSIEVHKDITEETIGELPDIQEELDINDLGIWIDPIDATAQYIKGEEVASKFDNIVKSGLKCATVLIGAYEKSSGKPIIGIINQPFFQQLADGYKSKIYWGCLGNYHNIAEHTERSHKIAILSSSECDDYKQTLKSLNYSTISSAGAGYKILKIISGDADIYLLSQDTTYRWDTCSCQAILNALGGGLVDLKTSILAGKPIDVTYDDDVAEKANKGGLVAYRCKEYLEEILQELKNLSM